MLGVWRVGRAGAVYHTSHYLGNTNYVLRRGSNAGRKTGESKSLIWVIMAEYVLGAEAAFLSTVYKLSPLKRARAEKYPNMFIYILLSQTFYSNNKPSYDPL